MAKTDLTAERLRELLHYDPQSGVFAWRHKRPGISKAGTVASCNSHGYIVIRVDRHLYPAHRLAWLYMNGRWPTNQIDHIDECRSNNSIRNLREATKSENMQNRSKPNKKTASKILGAYWVPGAKKWESRICANKCKRYLGLFETPELAHAAYIAAKRTLHPFGRL